MTNFNFDPIFWMQEKVQAVIAAENARLEEEAKTFLRMGYSLNELTVCCYDDGHKEIHPKERA